MEPAAREPFVRQSCEGDQRLFEEVSSLLASYGEADDLFLNPVIEGVTRRDLLEGRQLGQYRILRRLGQGGMGAVYLGERADDQFRRRVAIKLMRPGFDDGHLLRRFSNERQLLAVLDHPNIVKLLDAGVTEDGIPYFVMDYVEGQPIDQYCETQGLSIRERLELFREVCAAVHCAHRNLVVHRDLKPGNILVTPDGTPKLLDFGIAKLLRPEFGTGAIGLTRTLQPMTPEFASPEQVTGQPITTSSDVYSLGVLLYRLIAGKHPYVMNTASAAEVERVICETIPERPTLAARARSPARRKPAGSSDLDNIVLMAMRKEPQRRYPSAEHLSEDIRRYLASLPVTARKDTVFYRASKFVSRNRIGVASATVAVSALIGVGIYAVIQKVTASAQLAMLQHSQHFMLYELDVKLARSLTLGRKALVTEATGQIEAMARGAGGDERLLVDAGNGYHKIGTIEGNPLAPNLGEYDKARASYQKELDLASAMRPGTKPRLLMANAHMGLGRLDTFSGSSAEAGKHFEAAMGLYSAERYKHGIMNVWEGRGRLAQSRGDVTEACKRFETSLRYAVELDQEKHGPATQADIGTESLLYGLALARAGRTEESLAALHRALTIAQAIAEDPAGQREVSRALEYIGYVLYRAGRLKEALEDYRRALPMCEKAVREDSQNVQALIDLGQMRGEIANVLWDSNLKDESASATDGAIEILQPILDRGADAVAYFLQQYAEFLLAPSNRHPDPAAALRYAQRANTLEHQSNPETMATVAHAYAAMGDQPQAQDAARQALAAMPTDGDARLRKELEDRLKPPH